MIQLIQNEKTRVRRGIEFDRDVSSLVFCVDGSPAVPAALRREPFHRDRGWSLAQYFKRNFRAGGKSRGGYATSGKELSGQDRSRVWNYLEGTGC